MLNIKIVGLYPPVEGFTTAASMSKPSQNNSRSSVIKSRAAQKILLGRSGGGPGKSLNSNSGSNPDNYSLHSSQKTAPKIINYSLGFFSFKNERQSNLAKIKQQLNESIQKENKINVRRRKFNKEKLL